MIISYWGDQYSHLDTLNIKIRPLFQILLTEQDVARSLVPILATKEALAPLANDPIMLRRPIRSFRDLEHQNPPIISDSIDSARCGEIFSSNFGHQGVSGATCK